MNLHEELLELQSSWDKKWIDLMLKRMKEIRDEVHEIVEWKSDRGVYDWPNQIKLANVQKNIKIVETFLSDENLWDC